MHQFFSYLYLSETRSNPFACQASLPAAFILSRRLHMLVTAVMVQVKPDAITKFIEATIANHTAAIRESGNLRFDVLQNTNDPSRFMLYEAYESEEAAAAHKQTPHYLEWKKTVEPWMFKPREGIPYSVVAPLEKKKWR
jgi:(4S)-4-hydroxy-5-phosphonooxypentane-2,3-dione isomerase